MITGAAGGAACASWIEARSRRVKNGAVDFALRGDLLFRNIKGSVWLVSGCGVANGE
jgi:hypothetical protein